MPTSVFSTENKRSRWFIFSETGHRLKLCPSVAKKDASISWWKILVRHLLRLSPGENTRRPLGFRATRQPLGAYFCPVFFLAISSQHEGVEARKLAQTFLHKLWMLCRNFVLIRWKWRHIDVTSEMVRPWTICQEHRKLAYSKCLKGSMPPSIGHMELLVWMQRADFSEHIQGFKSPGDP